MRDLKDLLDSEILKNKKIEVQVENWRKREEIQLELEKWNIQLQGIYLRLESRKAVQIHDDLKRLREELQRKQAEVEPLEKERMLSQFLCVCVCECVQLRSFVPPPSVLQQKCEALAPDLTKVKKEARTLETQLSQTRDDLGSKREHFKLCSEELRSHSERMIEYQKKKQDAQKELEKFEQERRNAPSAQEFQQKKVSWSR